MNARAWAFPLRQAAQACEACGSLFGAVSTFRLLRDDPLFGLATLRSWSSVKRAHAVHVDAWTTTDPGHVMILCQSCLQRWRVRTRAARRRALRERAGQLTLKLEFEQ
jgi:hypothetical protein